MKQGLTLPIRINMSIDIDLIEKIEFKIGRGPHKIRCAYPSDKVTKVGAKKIEIKITSADTYNLMVGPNYIDSKVYLKNSEYNPKTPILEFELDPTFFAKGEIE